MKCKSIHVVLRGEWCYCACAFISWCALYRIHTSHITNHRSSKLATTMYSGSLVEYIYDANGPKPYKCGYCRSPDTSLTQGLLSYRMTCQDYQDLVDRGFQRSGRFVYRADMKRTCCPQYVIRMDVTEFTVTKAQRRAIKRFNEYLLYDKRYDDRKTPIPMEEEDGAPDISAETNKERSHKEVEYITMDTGSSVDHQSVVNVSDMPQSNDIGAREEMEAKGGGSGSPCQGVQAQDSKQNKAGKPKKSVRPGVGPDPNKPPCRKAKLVRKERKAQKLAAKQQQMVAESNASSTASGGVEGKVKSKTDSSMKAENVDGAEGSISASKGDEVSQEESSAKSKNESSKSLFAQDLTELLTLPNEADCKHKFETRLIRVNPRSTVFLDTYDESYAVFKKFQMIIHQEPEEDSTERHFEEFLVSTPMENEVEGCENMPCMFGTYHQQYLIDGKIFAVGVLDILPRGVLCEYLYYDPDYRFIAPGVYTALQEIAFNQRLFRVNPQMQYYYMGFYVQSCPKMNYKSRYNAGYLLCPETYQYIPIALCIPKLKASPYSRLADESVPNAKEGCTEDELDAVPMLCNMSAANLATYKKEKGEACVPLVKEYVELVGLEVAMKMNLFISRRGFF